MTIKENLLQGSEVHSVSYKESPNHGAKIVPEFLIIHYTAGQKAQSAINWLTKKEAQASAHLVIDRNGDVTQLVPFNLKAWHAGNSSYNGRKDFNNFSIGIELVNAGKLINQNGLWRDWWGSSVDNKEVLEASHKFEAQIYGWQTYTTEQLEAALEVAILLFNEYPLKDVLGHDDIAYPRKTDPGPAFPMENFRARLLGRR